jgi:hypothetical protein
VQRVGDMKPGKEMPSARELEGVLAVGVVELGLYGSGGERSCRGWLAAQATCDLLGSLE